MFAAIWAFAYALGIFALMAEVKSPVLLIVGWFMAVWMVITGAVSGWVAFRK